MRASAFHRSGFKEKSRALALGAAIRIGLKFGIGKPPTLPLTQSNAAAHEHDDTRCTKRQALWSRHNVAHTHLARYAWLSRFHFRCDAKSSDARSLVTIMDAQRRRRRACLLQTTTPPISRRSLVEQWHWRPAINFKKIQSDNGRRVSPE